MRLRPYTARVRAVRAGPFHAQAYDQTAQIVGGKMERGRQQRARLRAPAQPHGERGDSARALQLRAALLSAAARQNPVALRSPLHESETLRAAEPAGAA